MERDPVISADEVAAARPRVDGPELLAIFLGGSIGAVARAALVQGVHVRPGEWPWATFTANIVAALLLGYVITRLQERLPPYTYHRSFLGTGICGALSTFSTMMIELLRMIDGDYWGLAFGYGGASVAGGLAGVFVSTKLVRRAALLR